MANIPTPDPIKQHVESLPFAFFVGPLVSPKENYPGNVLKTRKYMSTKH